MPGSTRKKTPGKLNAPLPQPEFNALPLSNWCGSVQGVFYRLHSIDPSTGKPYPPVYFSRKGSSRFDPRNGPGTLYIGKTLAGVLMEIFDDRWGPVGDITRSLTESELREWFVSLITIPPITAFFASQASLSKIGTDSQLISGDHALSRKWALRLIRHPAEIEGIYYQSRHNSSCWNLALLRTKRFLPAREDEKLMCGDSRSSERAAHTAKIVYGPPVPLGAHPGLPAVLKELEIAVLP